MRLLSVVVLVLALSACGGGGDDEAPTPTPSPDASSTSEAAPALSLAEVCAELDAAVPDDFALPSPSFLDEYKGTLNRLSESADPEAQDLLTILAGTTTEAQAAVSEFDAGEPFDRGLLATNEACG